MPDVGSGANPYVRNPCPLGTAMRCRLSVGPRQDVVRRYWVPARSQRGTSRMLYDRISSAGTAPMSFGRRFKGREDGHGDIASVVVAHDEVEISARLNTDPESEPVVDPTNEYERQR